MTRHSSHPRPRAFTLIELMVVISIIVVLVGIVFTVGTTLGAGTSITRTKNYMEVLDGTLTEWQARSDRTVTWGVDGAPVSGAQYDMQEGTYHVFLISEFLATVGASSDVGTILAQIDQDHLVKYEAASGVPEWIRNPSANEPDPNAGSWATDLASRPWYGLPSVLDAWDHPIRVIHPGRTWTQGDPLPLDMIAGDGTVQTPLEAIYASCKNRRPMFVSAGPDGEFGDLTLPEDDPVHLMAHDNIYSYQPEHP